MSTIQTVLDQMAEAGLGGLAAADLIVDGRVHRFRPEGHRHKTAWYILFSYTTAAGKELIVGKFGDWRWGDEGGVKVSIKGAGLDKAELQSLRKQQAEQAQAAKQARIQAARRAAARARSVWSKLILIGSNAYLARKRVQGYGLRYSKKNAVVVPMRDASGTIQGLQVIHDKPRRNRDGDWITKDFWPYGMDPRGLFYRIGPEPGQDEPLFLVEGYATGASGHEATGHCVFVAFTAGNLLVVAQAVRTLYPRNPIIVAGDDDYLTTKPVANPGRMKAIQAADKVGGVAITPRFAARPDGTKWTDFNDLHVNEGLDAVRAQWKAAAGSPQFQDFRAKFHRSSNGGIQSNPANIALVLEHDPDWQGVLGYCDFSYKTMKRRPPPFEGGETGEWSDADTARLRIWLSDRYGFTPGTGDCDDAVLVVSQRNRFHPVRDWLNSLVWDGTERLAHWLEDGLGVVFNDYTRAVAEKWMIAAVARVMKPPVKADCVMILEGPQGLGKSTALAILGGEWFADTHFALGEKDGYHQMQGVFIVELSELDSFNKAETTRAKSFFSSLTDRYRPAYGRRPQDFPRQCVFAGTTNQDAYLKDVTGNRRYWPVRCTELEVDYLRSNRDQLWAEAVVRYHEKVPWWVLPSELALFEKEQEARFQEDAWEAMVGRWLEDPQQRREETFSTSDILIGALQMAAHQMKPPEQTRVGLIMSRLGWKKVRKSVNGRREYQYQRPKLTPNGENLS